MNTDSQESATRKKAILVFVFVVSVIVVAVMALRGGETNKKGSETVVSTSSGQSDSNEAVGERHASTGATAPTTSESNANAGGAQAGSSGTAMPTASGITSGAPVDMTQLLLEAKVVDQARSALAAGDPKRALEELEFYDKIPNASSLKQEATILKIQALSQVGRKTDARALAYSTRDDPSFKSYQDRVTAALDAGR